MGTERQAVEYLQAAVRSDPYDAEFHDYLAVLCQQVGNKDEATKENETFKQLRENPSSSRIHPKPSICQKNTTLGRLQSRLFGCTKQFCARQITCRMRQFLTRLGGTRQATGQKILPNASAHIRSSPHQVFGSQPRMQQFRAAGLQLRLFARRTLYRDSAKGPGIDAGDG
jgi:hypothetical protein